MIRKTGVAMFGVEAEDLFSGGLNKMLQEVSQVTKIMPVMETVDTSKMARRT
ncbi:MAG: hypothetical protein WC835_02785 [Candidatus Paceibacterota bacterium]